MTKCLEQTVLFMLHLFSFREPEILECTGQGCLHEQPPEKTPGTESLMNPPLRQQLYTCCHNSSLEELSASCVTVTPLGEDSGDLACGFLQTSPHVSFLFTDLLHHSCGWDSMLSPVCPSANH